MYMIHLFHVRDMFLCVGDMRSSPVDSTIGVILFTEKSIDPEFIAITLL